MKNIWRLSFFLPVALFAGCEKSELISLEDTKNTEKMISHTVDTIFGRYIIVLDESHNEGLRSVEGIKAYNQQVEFVKEEVTALANKFRLNKSKIRNVYAAALKGFTIELTASEYQKVKDDPYVLSIEPDIEITVPSHKINDPLTSDNTLKSSSSSQAASWGVAKVGGSQSAIGKRVWIIDSGVELNHPDLVVNTQLSKSFLSDDNSPDDKHGHGTHVAGIIAAKNNSIGVIGIAAGATVIAVRVLDENNSGALSEIIQGIDYVAANAAPGESVNHSIGPLTRIISTAWENAINGISDNQINIVLAAGNNHDDTQYYSPMRLQGARLLGYRFVVSAMEINNNFATFSNYGSSISYAAPGVSIYSTDIAANGYYSTKSGTSMAAPFLTGILTNEGNPSRAEYLPDRSNGYVNNDPDGFQDPIAYKTTWNKIIW